MYVPINCYSLCVNKFVKKKARNARRTWSQCMPGRVLTPCAQENLVVDARNILQVKNQFSLSKL